MAGVAWAGFADCWLVHASSKAARPTPPPSCSSHRLLTDSSWRRPRWRGSVTVGTRASSCSTPRSHPPLVGQDSNDVCDCCRLSGVSVTRWIGWLTPRCHRQLARSRRARVLYRYRIFLHVNSGWGSGAWAEESARRGTRRSASVGSGTPDLGVGGTAGQLRRVGLGRWPWHSASAGRSQLCRRRQSPTPGGRRRPRRAPRIKAKRGRRGTRSAPARVHPPPHRAAGRPAVRTIRAARPAPSRRADEPRFKLQRQRAPFSITPWCRRIRLWSMRIRPDPTRRRTLGPAASPGVESLNVVAPGFLGGSGRAGDDGLQTDRGPDWFGSRSAGLAKRRKRSACPPRDTTGLGDAGRVPARTGGSRDRRPGRVGRRHQWGETGARSTAPSAPSSTTKRPRSIPSRIT